MCPQMAWSVRLLGTPGAEKTHPPVGIQILAVRWAYCRFFPERTFRDLGGQCGRGPRDQAAGHLVCSWLSLSIDGGEEQLGGQATHCLQVHVDG